PAPGFRPDEGAEGSCEPENWPLRRSGPWFHAFVAKLVGRFATFTCVGAPLLRLPTTAPLAADAPVATAWLATPAPTTPARLTAPSAAMIRFDNTNSPSQ